MTMPRKHFTEADQTLILDRWRLLQLTSSPDSSESLLDAFIKNTSYLEVKSPLHFALPYLGHGQDATFEILDHPFTLQGYAQ